MPWKAITSMICITCVITVALFKDVNGILLAGGIAALAGLGGYVIARRSNRQGNHNP